VTGWRGEAGRGAAALASAAVTDHSRGDDSGRASAAALGGARGSISSAHSPHYLFAIATIEVGPTALPPFPTQAVDLDLQSRDHDPLFCSVL